jgi:hypothetical protein
VGYVGASSKNGKTANIKDIRFVNNLRNLTGIVFEGMPISDLSSLKNLKSLRRIVINSINALDNIASIQVLESLPNLEELCLDNLKKLKRPEQTLIKLKNLRILSARGRYIKDWNFIKNLNNLEKLTTSPDADFQTISQLKNLNILCFVCDPFSGNQLPNLDQFQDFKHLEKLEICFSGIKRNISDDYLNQLRAMLPNTELVVTGG